VFPVRKFYIEQMFALVGMQFHNYVETQRWNVSKGLCDVYTTGNFECCKCARVRFNCANGLAVPCRECWSVVTKESARFDNNDSEPKWQARQLFLKKIKIFQRHMLSKAFCHFPDVRRRTNIFGEEAIADHKVEEYKDKLQDYWRSSKQNLTISKS